MKKIYCKFCSIISPFSFSSLFAHVKKMFSRDNWLRQDGHYPSKNKTRNKVFFSLHQSTTLYNGQNGPKNADSNYAQKFQNIGSHHHLPSFLVLQYVNVQVSRKFSIAWHQGDQGLISDGLGARNRPKNELKRQV